MAKGALATIDLVCVRADRLGSGALAGQARPLAHAPCRRPAPGLVWRYAVHSRQPGPGAPPSAPPWLERQPSESAKPAKLLPLTMRALTLLPLVLALASCANHKSPSASGSAAHSDLLKNSPECLAADLRPMDPLPASAIPEDILRKAQSGWVAVNYDVVAGRAQNVRVVSSSPPGLYDAYVLRHAATYTEPSKASVRGCVTTTNINF